MDIDNYRYYDILNVSKDATKEEIKNQYKKLASKYDSNKTDTNILLEINEAYEVLSDTNKKKIYDKYGEEGLDKLQYEDQYLNDKQTDKNRKCKSRVYFALVSLEDIYKGSEININYSRKIVCNDCKGTGSDNPSIENICSFCNGKGRSYVMQNVSFFIMQNCVECENCEGSGFEKNYCKCKTCKGDKFKYEKKSIKVNVEKGSPDSHKIILKNEGDQAPNAITGDLIIELVIKKHDYFTREGADLYYTQYITLLESIIGFSKLIPTLDKTNKIKISPEDNEVIQHNDLKTIIGYGLPFFKKNNKYGNLFVQFNIVFPTNLDYLKLIEVEKLLKERRHTSLINIENSNFNSENKKIYRLTNFIEEDFNTNVAGGQSEDKNYCML